MRNFDHVLDRVEREIEEIMGEKKWTPKHAEALEELLMCEKCVKEIEKLAHAKKRMLGLPAPTEEEDEEMMMQPWHFARGGGGRGRGNNRGNYEQGGGNYEQGGNYERGGSNYEDGNYEGSGNYERNNYARGNYENNRRNSNYGYNMIPPKEYHHLPPYMEEEMMMTDPMMRHKMPPLPYMYGGSPYNYGWDPMMEERELWKKRRSRGLYEDDDDEEEEKKRKRGNYENANSVGTPGTDSNSSGGAKPR